jgi:NAD(P)-dependent dehydrogenase (short-subunit alcohol dehydrogenase family)
LTHAEHPTLQSIPSNGLAIVIGSRGGIGAAMVQALQGSGRFGEVMALSRSSIPALDITLEPSVVHWAQQAQSTQLPLRLVVDATGFLHGNGMQPEKSWQHIDPVQMAHAFAINAMGPALLMKHFLPLLARDGKSVFATLSAKVGSIGDNQLGGWYSYRASKAALNQLVRTAAIELRRKHPHAVCVALHPGTVDTGLTSPFAKTGLQVVTPAQAALRLLHVLDGLDARQSGGFINHDGQALPW